MEEKRCSLVLHDRAAEHVSELPFISSFIAHFWLCPAAVLPSLTRLHFLSVKEASNHTLRPGGPPPIPKSPSKVASCCFSIRKHQHKPDIWLYNKNLTTRSVLPSRPAKASSASATKGDPVQGDESREHRQPVWRCSRARHQRHLPNRGECWRTAGERCRMVGRPAEAGSSRQPFLCFCTTDKSLKV